MQNKKMIHIKAESEIFSCFEIVEEKKAVKRLKEIREGFLFAKSHYFGRLANSKLKVTTAIINPTLFSI